MGALVCAHRICMVANPHACDDGVSAEEVARNLLIQTDDAAIFSAIQDVRPKVNGALKNVYHIRFGACATAMGGATRTCRPTLYTRAQHKTLHTHTHTHRCTLDMATRWICKSIENIMTSIVCAHRICITTHQRLKCTILYILWLMIKSNKTNLSSLLAHLNLLA